MTDPNHAENDSDHSTVHSTNKPGQVEKVDPTTGGTHSIIETGRKPKK